MLTMRLFCLLKTNPDNKLELIAAINEIAKYDGIKEIFEKDPSATKIDSHQLLTMILNISKQLDGLSILESIIWIKSPIHGWSMQPIMSRQLVCDALMMGFMASWIPAK